MSQLKTQPTKASVAQFLNSIENPEKRKDIKNLAKMLGEITGAKPILWGSSIVGLGNYHYKYASGRAGDWFTTRFAPRKQALTIYIMGGHKDKSERKPLGKYSTTKGCLYIERLADVAQAFLKKYITQSVSSLK